jgi:hypothetical protein
MNRAEAAKLAPGLEMMLHMEELLNDKPTFGEKAVGLSFNPSGDERVRLLKEAYAAIVDICNDAREEASDAETKRLWSIAITEAQGAQMWSVKAATWGK